ncbi:MAG TPA: HNH endonuclease signature motif containing protein [Blastocatellia bacterium]|nr:HNH endonuclease signature motif containing protein [Blastocatellia bacterium]
MQVVDALDRPIAFHRCFVTITGSVNAALMLSQALYWSKRSKDPEGWFYKTTEDWTEETGMTRAEQEDSRRRLIAYGFISEVRKGMPARLHYKINSEAINLALTENTTKPLVVDDVLEIFAGPLKTLSRTGWMRAKKLGAEGAYVDYSVVLKSHGMTCSICRQPITKGPGKTEDALCFDHIIPLNCGGSHTVENLAPAHFKCDGQKSDGDGSPGCSEPDKQVRLPQGNKSVYHRETSLPMVRKHYRLPQTNMFPYQRRTLMEQRLQQRLQQRLRQKKKPPPPPPSTTSPTPPPACRSRSRP